MESSDAELIARVHEGEASGFAELYARHRKAAKAYARRLTPATDADDLVADGFTQVFVQSQRGAGPRTVLRPYLFTTIRNLHLRRSRRDRRLVVTGDEVMLDTPVEFEDTPGAEFDRTAAVRAFGSLPDRWRGVLWSLDVERRAASDIAPAMGLSPNAVSALAVRAREGLRQAYLREHLAVVTDPDCRSVLENLPAYVRGSASRRRRDRIDEHLPGLTTTTDRPEVRTTTDQPGLRVGPRERRGKVAGRRDEPPSVSGGRQERRHGGMASRSRHTGIRDRRGPVSRPSLVQETAAPGRDAKSRGKIG